MVPLLCLLGDYFASRQEFLVWGEISWYHGDNKFAQRMSGKDEKSAERSGWYDGTENSCWDF